jgi:predicted secreted protein
MRYATGFAIYFVIWWLVLFVTLPWGAHSPHEKGEEVLPGHAPSAPLRPMLVRKMLATTVISAAIFAAYWWANSRGYLSPDNWGFIPGID